MTNNKLVLPSQLENDREGIIKKLASIGLTETDVAVYIYLLDRGIPLSNASLAAKLSIRRQYAHTSLNKLVGLNLAEVIVEGIRKKYQAYPLTYLLRLAKQRHDEVEQVARQLEKVSSVGADQDFEIYRGIGQVLSFEENIVNDLQKNETQYIIGGGAEAFVTFFGERYNEFSSTAFDSGLRSNYVGCREEIPWLEKAKAANKYFEYRILDTLPKTIVQTAIRFNTVTFYSFGKPPLVYIIKSEIVAADYKKFFDMLWNMAQPYNS